MLQVVLLEGFFAFLMNGEHAFDQHLSQIIERLSSEVRASLKAADAVAKISDDLGLTIVASTPDELAVHLRRDIDAVGSLAKAIGLEPE